MPQGPPPTGAMPQNMSEGATNRGGAADSYYNESSASMPPSGSYPMGENRATPQYYGGGPPPDQRAEPGMDAATGGGDRGIGSTLLGAVAPFPVNMLMKKVKSELDPARQAEISRAN